MIDQDQISDASTVVVVGIVGSCLACGTMCAVLCCLSRRFFSRGGDLEVEVGHPDPSKDGLSEVQVEPKIVEEDLEAELGHPGAFSDDDSEAEIGRPGLDETGDQVTQNGLRKSMDFWFVPVSEIMRMPVDAPIPRHQTCRDMGLLVKRRIDIDDVLSGNLRVDTAAVSHRWPVPEHFDPQCTKLSKLQEVLPRTPSIKWLWIDWICAPQWHDGGRTDEEEVEFKMILKHILPFIFLGCKVIVLYERIYNQRFWPNVECWIATKMATPHGLVPASDDRLRVLVHGIHSAGGHDKANLAQVLEYWHRATAQEAITILSHDDILVTNAKDKEVNLKVVASLDEQIRCHHSSLHVVQSIRQFVPL
ncbi:unnamed protein product [Prorocentrum cordatum]|uniref:Heterokaryon incompatibility domain-containing protein n=1 Tax=Prorocentrum cordatum TaxID=2364126 RepID=A0ABN9WRQ4_9DINO|nr:unnamed protein product [Polarella glacialis]